MQFAIRALTRPTGPNGRVRARRPLVHLAVALTLHCAGAAPAPALTLPVAEDASSKSGALTTTLGKATTLPVAKNRHAFVRFEADGQAAVAPVGDVRSARLVLFLTSVKTVGELDVYDVAGDWSEAPAAAVPAPALGDATPKTVPAAAVVAKRFVAVDVTGIVKAWLAGTLPDFGFAVVSRDGLADVQLAAKEGYAKGHPAVLEVEVDGGDRTGVWNLNGTSAFYNGGRVGIGTAAPANPFTLLATGHGFEHTDGAVRLGTFVSGSGGWLGTISNDDLHFFVDDGNASMTVDVTGNVGIATTSPDATLEVGGDTRIGGRLNVNSAGFVDATMTLRQRTFGDNHIFRALDADGFNALALSHHVAGNTLSVYGDAEKSAGGTSWSTLSDRRLKQDVRAFDTGLQAVLRLRPVRFRYRDDVEPGLSSTREQVGLIAQDVRTAIPEAVSERSDGRLLLHADPIHWATINAIRELSTRLEERDIAPRAEDPACAARSEEPRRDDGGTVVTDANGDAVVTLAEAFDAPAGALDYQLTVIGTFAQAIVSRELHDRTFGIKTDRPNVKVSWQVSRR